MKQVEIAVAVMLMVVGTGQVQAGSNQCVMTATGLGEATLCQHSTNYVIGSAGAKGEGRLIIVTADGHSEIATSDYQDKLGLTVKKPTQKLDKIVFVGTDGIILGGIGWGESELDSLVNLNGAGRLNHNFVKSHGKINMSEQIKLADDNGGFGPKDDNGGFGPKDDNGGFGPKDDNGGFGPKRGATVADDNGGFGPKDDNGGFGPKDDNGGFGPKHEATVADDNGGFGPKSLILVSQGGDGNGGTGRVAFNGNGGAGGSGDVVAQGGDGNGGTGIVASVTDDNGGFGPKLPNLQGINARCLGTMIFFSN